VGKDEIILRIDIDHNNLKLLSRLCIFNNLRSI